MKSNYVLILLLLSFSITMMANRNVKFSTAGFYELPETGRKVFSMNQAWKFYKGNVDGVPYSVNFDDSSWETVSIPHGLEYLPIESSGCVNYQGIAWYRKYFTPEKSLKGKKIFLHFEAIMGKSKVYLNGKLIKEYYGGYLPVIADVTKELKYGEENIIAVKADNSDDPLYPVGKPQSLLDFTYFGGIYRDCWLIVHNDVFITDANYENEIAGGGIFVSYDKVSEKNAEINIKAHIRNSSDNSKSVNVVFALKDNNGNLVSKKIRHLGLSSGKAKHTQCSMDIENPNLWSPEHPFLYNLDITIEDNNSNVIDGYRRRIGIRSIEFKQTEGLWINGKPYQGKIMGTNRHQDFAVLGNAVPNSIQWRDAKKLRDAGLKVVRTHYVIDPAFMDACDELGLFALVEVPGWQFWNKEPIFAERIYSDIRNMIRIHRNHASLFFWEPILNETNYPKSFAKKALEICEEEYPYPYSIAACDHGASGDEYYSLLLRPIENKIRTDRTYFIREWGDNVDDWNAHNSDSRASREWGEVPMLIQAEHYANPYYINDYSILCYETICQKTSQIVGACFWHSFDHQRGYHADPFYGGIMDAFRQPKTAYYMFMSQRTPEKSDIISETGPMVYIAHELTPFSPRDITVYSNCDEVHLTVFEGGKVYTYKKDKTHKGMPSPIIKFEKAFNFMEWKGMARSRKHNQAYLLAEGLMDGKVVVRHKRYPSGQADHLQLRLDSDGLSLQADGSDVITIVAEVVDKNGNVKRLNNSMVKFNIEGEGRILGGEVAGVNPQKIEWGSAVAIVQSTNKQGKIRLTASLDIPGQSRPLEGVIEFNTSYNTKRELYSEKNVDLADDKTTVNKENKYNDELEKEILRLRKELNQLKVKEVEKQQTQFGVGIND